MSKFHINEHGFPTSCRAKKGNCPLGGVSGNENHFSTREEAWEAIDLINERKRSLFSHKKPYEQYNYNLEELKNMENKIIAIEYDGKRFVGEVIGTYYVSKNNDRNGIIIQDNLGVVKHIKTHRLTKVNLEENILIC